MAWGALVPLAIGAGKMIWDAVSNSGDEKTYTPYVTHQSSDDMYFQKQWSPTANIAWENLMEGVVNPANRTGQGYVNQARDLDALSRYKQDQALSQLERYASGEASAAREESRAALQQLQRDIAARAASTPGGYNPAIARAALYAQKGAGQDIAQSVAAQAAQERLGAAQAYQQGVGALRESDLRKMQAEQQFWAQQEQARAMFEELKSKYANMGLTESMANQQALLELQRIRSGAYEGAQNRQAKAYENQADRETAQRESTFKGIMGGVSDYLESEGKRGQENNQQSSKIDNPWANAFSKGKDSPI